MPHERQAAARKLHLLFVPARKPHLFSSQTVEQREENGDILKQKMRPSTSSGGEYEVARQTRGPQPRAQCSLTPGTSRKNSSSLPHEGRYPAPVGAFISTSETSSIEPRPPVSSWLRKDPKEANKHAVCAFPDCTCIELHFIIPWLSQVQLPQTLAKRRRDSSNASRAGLAV